MSVPRLYFLFFGAPVGLTTTWVLYKQFPGIRGELQGGVLEGFDLFFGEFSVNFPDEFSVEKGKPRVVVRRVKKSLNFHDPLVGTDTTGPGEAVSAIG